MKKIKRGDMINVSTSVVGRYVGTDRAGVVWFAYRDEDFEVMCEAFDSRPR